LGRARSYINRFDIKIPQSLPTVFILDGPEDVYWQPERIGPTPTTEIEAFLHDMNANKLPTRGNTPFSIGGLLRRLNNFLESFSDTELLIIAVVVTVVFLLIMFTVCVVAPPEEIPPSRLPPRPTPPTRPSVPLKVTSNSGAGNAGNSIALAPAPASAPAPTRAKSEFPDIVPAATVSAVAAQISPDFGPSSASTAAPAAAAVPAVIVTSPKAVPAAAVTSPKMRAKRTDRAD
jgi:hypothetical protein